MIASCGSINRFVLRSLGISCLAMLVLLGENIQHMENFNVISITIQTGNQTTTATLGTTSATSKRRKMTSPAAAAAAAATASEEARKATEEAVASQANDDEERLLRMEPKEENLKVTIAAATTIAAGSGIEEQGDQETGGNLKGSSGRFQPTPTNTNKQGRGRQQPEPLQPPQKEPAATTTITLKRSNKRKKQNPTTTTMTTASDAPPSTEAATSLSSSASSSSSSSLTCSHASRRELARQELLHKGSTTEQHWKEMANCIWHQDQTTKKGQFFLHVSKSGGTSMIELWKDRGCLKKPNWKNPWDNHPSSDNKLGFYPHWYDANKVIHENNLKLPQFGWLASQKVQGTSCRDMEDRYQEQKRIGMMSESILPFHDETKVDGGGCSNYLTSMIFREPLKRIVSHYHHIARSCRSSKEHCRSTFYTHNPSTITSSKTFNVSAMTNIFPQISDNYYARSLVGGHGYYEYDATPLRKHPDAKNIILPTAMASLRSIDWIMIIGGGGEVSKEDEENNTDTILQYALGFGPETRMKHSRKKPPAKDTSSSSSSSSSSTQKVLELDDAKRLRQMNRLDYQLWEEAKKLNQLDVLSLQRMKPYWDQATMIPSHMKPYVEEYASGQYNGTCCGHVCRNQKDWQLLNNNFNNVVE